MARHILIATATSKYEHLSHQDNRPQLSRVLASIENLFTRKLKCYERVLDDIAENPPSGILRTHLDQWFASTERDPADWVVIYYTGHADVVGADALYLLTTDFMPNHHVSTAFSLQQFADLVLANRADGTPRQVQNMLLIVDTCFAGKGTLDLTSRLAAAFRKSSGNSFYLLGAALPREEALAGALAKALIDAIDDLSQRHVMAEWLYLEQIVPAVNRLLKCGGIQKAILSSLDSGSGEPKFFPNPSFVRTDRSAVVAADALRAISDQEFRDHWDPRSRGVEFDSDPGSYFTGRGIVVERLSVFLAGHTDSATRIVTGSPGAGKSAILSRLVSLSGSRKGNWYGEASAAISIDLAIHAKGKSLDDITARFAKVLGTEPKIDAVLNTVRASTKPLRIVVDALDESAQPAAIAIQLLRPLNSMESVRLIVGTRSNHLLDLGEGIVLNIDSPEYANKGDIAEYVKARLLRADEPNAETPYAKKDVIAGRVASIVAEKVYPNFLVARLAVEDLLSRTSAADPESAKEMSFPQGVADAFNAYLQRFGDKETAARDLLLPLAYAEGQGLPWDNIWPLLASELSGREYSDEDVRWLLSNAGAFILESSEDGHSVYRLYHQALADFLRSGGIPSSIHRIFARVLIGSVPLRIDGGGPDWFLANQYVRWYLATHAAASLLAPLLQDPVYLLAAKPDRLLRSIWRNWEYLPRDIARAYLEAVQNIRESSPQIAVLHLELIARRRGLSDLADRAAFVPISHICHVPWTKWVPEASCLSFGKGESSIRTLGVAEWDTSRMVALSGREDGSVEVWDIALGERIFHWKEKSVGSARHVAHAKGKNGHYLIASWSSDYMGCFDLESNQSTLVMDDSNGRRYDVTALRTVDRSGETVCITAHGNGRLVLRSLPSLEPIVEVADAGWIAALHPLTEKGHELVLSAGDNYKVPPYDPESPEIRMPSLEPCILKLWSLEDLSIIWTDERKQSAYLDNIDEAVVFGRKMISAFYTLMGHAEIWDLETRKLVFRDERSAVYSWLYKFKDDHLLVNVDFNRFKVRKLKEKDDESSTVVASDFGSPVKVQGDHFTGIFQLHGRASVLNATIDRIRILDFEDLLVQAIRDDGGRLSVGDEPQVTHVTALRSAPDGELLAACSSNLFSLNAETGAINWTLKLPVFGTVIELHLVRDAKLIVVGTSNGKLHILDRKSRARQRTITMGDHIRRLECFQWCGRDLAVATVARNQIWAVSIWDLGTGDELATNNSYRLHGGEEDKELRSLAVCPSEKEIKVVFASKYGKVMIATYDGNPPPPLSRARPRHYEQWYFPGAGIEYIDSAALNNYEGVSLLAAASEEGRLAIWNFQTGDVRASVAHAHVGHTNCLLFEDLLGRRTLISGGVDGRLRFWTVDLKELFSIDFGEPISAIARLSKGTLVVGGASGVVAFQFPERIATDEVVSSLGGPR